MRDRKGRLWFNSHYILEQGRRGEEEDDDDEAILEEGKRVRGQLFLLDVYFTLFMFILLFVYIVAFYVLF